MAAGTFTVAGQRVRSASQRRFVAFIVHRTLDGILAEEVRIWKRSDDVAKLRRMTQNLGFGPSYRFVIVDTTTGEEV
jgi:hypothetical protein